MKVQIQPVALLCLQCRIPTHYANAQTPPCKPHSKKWLRHILLRADALASDKDSELVKKYRQFLENNTEIG